MSATNIPWLMLHMVIENPETNCKLTWSIKTSLENLVDLKKVIFNFVTKILI